MVKICVRACELVSVFCCGVISNSESTIVQLNAEESLDLSTKVDNQSSTSNTRAIPSDAAEFERTEEINKTEAKVRKMPSGKDSCIETSGHPFPIHSENPEENVETVSDTSKTTSDVSNKVNKECPTADGSGKTQ